VCGAWCRLQACPPPADAGLILTLPNAGTSRQVRRINVAVARHRANVFKEQPSCR
jgi:hypothetical protein